MRVSSGIAAFLVVLGFSGATALATVIDPSLDCLSEDNERRISGCSAMIETPGLPPEQLSVAYGLRALGYSLKGWFDKAVAWIKPDDTNKIKQLLDRHGATFGDIVKMVTYLTDVRYQPDYGKCRAEVFGTTLVGNRSLSFRATLKKLADD